MLDKIKSMLSSLMAIEPKIIAMISLAPFGIGMFMGYILHGPISLLLSALRLLMKL